MMSLEWLLVTVLTETTDKELEDMAKELDGVLNFRISEPSHEMRLRRRNFSSGITKYKKDQIVYITK